MGSLQGDADKPGRFRSNGYLHRGAVGGHHHQNQNNYNSPRRGDVVDPQLTTSVGAKPGVVAALTHRFNAHHQPPPLFLQSTAPSRRRRSCSPPFIEVRNSTTQRPSMSGGGGQSRDFLPVVVNGAGQRISQQHQLHTYQPHHLEYGPAHAQMMAGQQQQQLQRRTNGGSWISVPTDRQHPRGHQRENTTPRLKYSHNYVTDDVINGDRNYAVDSRVSPRSSSTSGLETASGSILKKRSDGPQWDDSVAIRALGKPSPHDVIIPSSRSRHGHSNNNHSNNSYYKSGSKTSRSRRVLFKNNVAVYRFDSDGADSSAYSSTSESSELLNDGTRHQRDVTRPGGRGLTMMVGPEGRSLSSTVDVVADPGYYYPAAGRSHLTPPQQQQRHQHYGDQAGYLAAGGHYRAEPDRLLEGVVTTSKILPSPRDASVSSVDAERGRSTQQTHRRTPASLRNAHSVSPSPRTEHQLAGHESRDASGSRPPQQHPPSLLQTQTSLPLEDCLVGPHSSSIVRVRYVQVSDEAGCRLVLTCCLQPHRLFDPDNIVVKANRVGTRVRIVFATDENGEGPTDQLMLPETVDPYHLSARLESNCTLIIEAPIVR